MPIIVRAPRMGHCISEIAVKACCKYLQHTFTTGFVKRRKYRHRATSVQSLVSGAALQVLAASTCCIQLCARHSHLAMKKHTFTTICLLSVLSPLARAQNPAPARQFDFGNVAAPNFISVQTQTFSAPRGFGWLNADLLLRDRNAPDDLRRDFVWGHQPATFRISGLKAGRYKLTIISGDASYGDHRTRARIAGAPKLPLLEPAINEFVTLTATVMCGETCDIVFDSPIENWNVNALSLEPTTENLPPMISKESVKPAWNVSESDPTQPLLNQFLHDTTAPKDFRATQLSRADYLKLIAGGIDFWKTQQNAQGAIIDPYKKAEWQYSTPAYAHAAAALVVWNGRDDLLESAARAMDWATLRLGERKAANGHEDFYTPMLAHALRLLKPRVPAERAARWEANLQFDPNKIYRVAYGSNNWNVVSLAGEALLQKMGVRKQNTDYVEKSLAAQIRHFDSPHGLYLEGPLAYDHFPRLWLADLVADGYAGEYSAQLTETLRRAALTSLFMQSPSGELPAGGRSAHHQWNEAEQCVTYEVFAARALQDGDAQLASVYKRAAHLALSSMGRWVRPSGEMQIVKNWVDPAKNHAYEGYSAHSQYNLLPMSMLALAYERAASTEQVAEKPAPADVGGFVLDLPELHKVFANASGTYVQIDTSADHHYDATGLIRIHSKNLAPQLGPSDSVLAQPSYRVPANSPKTQNTGVGVAWKGKDGNWHRLGELSNEQIQKVEVKTITATPQRAEFEVIYSGDLFGIAQITEHYALSAGRVELTTELQNYNGALRYVWPILADDGRSKSAISVNDKTVSVAQTGSEIAQTFAATGAQSVRVEDELYPNHNGWARLGVAEFAGGGKITLVMESKRN